MGVHGGQEITSTGGAVNLAAGIAPPATKSELSDVKLRTYGVDLPETNSSSIVNVTVGGAGAGKVAAGFGVSTNIISNTIAAEVLNGAVVDGHAGVALSAIDASVIDAIAFGGAGSGSVAGGGAISVNVITNTIRTAVEGSTIETDGGLNLAAESSSVIRTLSVGVSGSGGGAFRFTAMGNAVVNTVEAVIDDSMVAAGGDVSLSASDIAPAGLIPEYLVPKPWAITLSEALEDSPIMTEFITHQLSTADLAQ